MLSFVVATSLTSRMERWLRCLALLMSSQCFRPACGRAKWYLLQPTSLLPSPPLAWGSSRFFRSQWLGENPPQANHRPPSPDGPKRQPKRRVTKWIIESKLGEETGEGKAPRCCRCLLMMPSWSGRGSWLAGSSLAIYFLFLFSILSHNSQMK